MSEINKNTPTELITIKQELLAGQTPKNTPRALMGWFGYFRRGLLATETVRLTLDRLGITTQPDFEAAYFDDTNMTFMLKESSVLSAPEKRNGKQTKSATKEATHDRGEQVETTLTHTEAAVEVPVDPPMMLSRLGATVQKPIVVLTEDSIETAVTLMLKHNFSQLPVFNSSKKGLMRNGLKGMISWRTIGQRLALGRKGEKVSDYMEHAVVLDAKASIFYAIHTIMENDCILFESAHMVTGIITQFDLLQHFGVLLEPFVLVGELERFLRALLSKYFSLDELRALVDGDEDRRKRLHSAANLTFGEYIRCLENGENWKRLNLQGIDRKTFVAALHEIREIRNEVMHFNTDSIEGDPTLRDTVEMLRKLKDLGVIEI